MGFHNGPWGRVYRFNKHGWRNARDRAGLMIRFHDLRHTFGGRAAAVGIPSDYQGGITRSFDQRYNRALLGTRVAEVA